MKQLVMVIAAWVWIGGVALAGGAGEEHLHRAREAEAAGDYPLAQTEYIAAYAQLHDAYIFYDLARAYELGGDAEPAAIYYRRYLNEVDVPQEQRRELLYKIAQLEATPLLVAPERGAGAQPEAGRRPASYSPFATRVTLQSLSLAPSVSPGPRADFASGARRLDVRFEPQHVKPNHAAHILWSIVAGTGGGVLGTIFGFGIGSALADCSEAHSHATLECEAPRAFPGAIAGYLLGSAAGVTLVWNSWGSESSYWYAVGGATLATAVALAIYIPTEFEPDSEALLAFALLAPPVAGATFGAWLSHEDAIDRRPAKVGALLNAEGERLTLGIPIPRRYTLGEATITALPIVGGRF